MITEKYRENIPFFSDLPTKAVRAAAALWDTARDASYNGALAYNEFVQDLSFHNIAAPPRAVVKRWVAGVQANLVPRPGGEAPKTDIVECADAAIAGEAALSAAMTDLEDEIIKVQIDPHYRPLTTVDFLPTAAVALDPADALGSVFEHLIDAATEELQRDIRKQARSIAATRLRAMLDEMEKVDG